MWEDVKARSDIPISHGMLDIDNPLHQGWLRYHAMDVWNCYVTDKGGIESLDITE